MNRFVASLTAAALLAASAAFPVAASAKMSTAMPTCAAGDPVVWVNTKSKAYHMQGDSYYGKTKAGMYACKSTADKNGMHASGSGKMSAMSGTTTKHKKSKMACNMSTMGMASPMPKHKKHQKAGAMASPSP